MSDLTDEDDGIHPLDRDYENPVPSPPKRFIFTKSRGLNLGILGFGVGGFILLIGIVLSQVGEGVQSFEAMAGNAHRVGMWSILFGGGCIIFTMQARVDRPRRVGENGIPILYVARLLQSHRIHKLAFVTGCVH